MSNYKDQILSFASSTKNYLWIFLKGDVLEDLLDYFELLLLKNKTVEIFLDESAQAHLKANSKLFFKTLNLRAKGLVISTCSITGELQVALIKDFETILRIDGDGLSQSSLREKSGELEWVDLESVVTNSELFKVSEQDPFFYINIGKTTLLKGEGLEYSWASSNVGDLNLNGKSLGGSRGEQSVTLETSQLLIIEAENAVQKQVRYIHVLDGLEINYDLEYLNPVSKQFVSLKQKSNYPNVFGVTHNCTLRLTWDCSMADKALIKPFDNTKKQGSHEFLVEDSFNITIRAEREGYEKSIDIVVQSFPIPIMEKEFIQVDSFEKKYLKDYRAEILTYLENNKRTDDLRADLRSQEQNILSRWENISLPLFPDRKEIQKINLSVFDRLSEYYQSKPKISKVIKSLKKLNEI